MCSHSNSVDDINAVLEDAMSLAHASVLVGNFNSNMFKIPWLLNYLRRTPKQRQELWCWDVFTNSPCNTRKHFVANFVDEAITSGVPFMPESSQAIRECLDSTLEI